MSLLTTTKGVDEPKRQRSGTWLYQRKRSDLESPQAVQPRLQEGIRPVIHTSRPREDDISRDAVVPGAAGASSQSSKHGKPQARPLSSSTPPPVKSSIEPRRFHMTRHRATPPLVGHAPNSGISKKSRYASTIFVERNIKRKRAGAAAVEKSNQQDIISAPTQDPSLAASVPGTSTDEGVKDVAPERFKRPGLAWRPKPKDQGADGVHKTKPSLPPSLLNRQHDDNMEQLARDMDAYALEQIGLNLNRMDEDRGSPESPTKSISTTPRKYRPKAPAKRYAERHPEAASQAEPDDVDMQESDTDDDNYVIETYVRVPASTLEASVPAEQVGLLVFDNSPDIEFFYGAEGDSDDEQLDDDDADSNGKIFSQQH